MQIISDQRGDNNRALQSYQEAVKILQVIAKQEKPEADGFAEMIALHERIGNVQYNMGLPAEAIESYEKSLELRNTNNSGEETSGVREATTLHRLMIAHQAIGNFKEAKGYSDKALHVLKMSTPALGDETRSHLLSRLHHSRAVLMHVVGKMQSAESHYHRALGLNRNAAMSESNTFEGSIYLLTILNNLGLLLHDSGQSSLAEPVYSRAIFAYDVAVNAREIFAEQRRRGLGSLVLGRVGTPASSIMSSILVRDSGRSSVVYEQPINLRARPLHETPRVHDEQEGWAVVQNNLGILRHANGKNVLAKKNYHTARGAFRVLVAKRPNTPRYLAGLAAVEGNLGIVLDRLQSVRAAKESFEAAVQSQETLVRDCPDVFEYKRQLSSIYHNYALHYQRIADNDNARRMYQRAIDMRTKIRDRHPEIIQYQTDVVESYFNLAVVERTAEEF